MMAWTPNGLLEDEGQGGTPLAHRVPKEWSLIRGPDWNPILCCRSLKKHCLQKEHEGDEENFAIPKLLFKLQEIGLRGQLRLDKLKMLQLC